jgi:hypothetical protein
LYTYEGSEGKLPSFLPPLTYVPQSFLLPKPSECTMYKAVENI